MNDMLESIKNICHKRPIERLSHEIGILMELTKSCKIFKNLIESNGANSHAQC